MFLKFDMEPNMQSFWKESYLRGPSQKHDSISNFSFCPASCVKSNSAPNQKSNHLSWGFGFSYEIDGEKPSKWYQHRPQTVQVNQLNQVTLKTTLLFGSFCDAQSMKRSIQIRAQPSPARPPEPNPTPNPAQRAQHGEIPRPTQPRAPSTAKSAPNTAQRAQ